MSRRINGYLCGMKMKIRQEQWFGTEFFLSFFAVFVQSVIYWLLFYRLFAGSSSVDAKDISLYYVIVNIVALSMLPAQYAAYRHMDDINSGKMTLCCMRPLSYPLARYLDEAGVFFLRAVFNLVLIFIVSALLHRAMRPAALFLGALSMLAGFTILYLIQSVIGCFTVWFHDILRFRDVFMTFLMALGGRLIPSSLLFSGLKKVVYYTPVPYIYDIPSRVLMGDAGVCEVLLQLAWALAFLALYLWLFTRYVAHGLEFGG